MRTLTTPRILSFLFCLFFSSSILAASIDSFSQMSAALQGKSNKQKQAAITWLMANPNQSQSQLILQSWLDSELFIEKSTKRLAVMNKLAVGEQAQFIVSGSSITVDNKRAFKKIRVNNKLRKLIRSNLAKLSLYSTDDTTRLAAVKSLIGVKDSALIAEIKRAQQAEKNSDILDAMHIAIAAFEALSADKSLQLAAIETLSSRKDSIVFSRLNEVIESSSDDDVIAAAKKGIVNYQQSQIVYSSLETAFFGLSMGSILVLAAIGLAITFGVMGVINMAHGELIMIGAYTTYVMQLLMPNHLGLSLFLSIPAAFMVSGAVGIAIERGVIRHLYGRPLETLLATFGLSLVLQQAVRSIFSPLNRSVSTPDFMSGALEINPMWSITYNRLYIVLFCFAVFLALVALLKKTPLGLQVRAVSQNRPMAKAMGIRSERVDALTFGLGSGVAGVAGVALSQLTNVGPNMGQAYIIDSFMVVVFGGVGNLWGTLVAGLGLGIFNKVLEPWAGAVLAKILVLVFIILFIQKRPRGLFPQRGRAAEG